MKKMHWREYEEAAQDGDGYMDEDGAADELEWDLTEWAHAHVDDRPKVVLVYRSLGADDLEGFREELIERFAAELHENLAERFLDELECDTGEDAADGALRGDHGTRRKLMDVVRGALRVYAGHRTWAALELTLDEAFWTAYAEEEEDV